jgi:phage repressor protein C with HTH and peptisase S24 domain
MDDITEEAARLKAIYKARKREDPSLNQKKIAEECDWTSQSVVSQYMTGRISLNIAALLKFSAFLGFQPEEVSPRLTTAFPIEGFKPYAAPSTMGRTSSLTCTNLLLVEQGSSQTQLGPDEVELLCYQEVNRADGKGTEVRYNGNGHTLPFSRRILEKAGLEPEVVRCLVVEDNRMTPVLPEGSLVAIDISEQPIHNGKLYAVDYGGQLRLHLIYKLPGNGLRLKSYNGNEYPEEILDRKFVAKNIKILGRVFWYCVAL